jgi:hypothetical protein
VGRPTGPTTRWRTREVSAGEQDALLGAMADADVAAIVGRSAEAVRSRRQVKKVATFVDRRRSVQNSEGVVGRSHPAGR